ncbi:uncharacterized protein BJ171DRAFT_596795 [Polychytrium aggregatum]|uniref:uncharacterized protein n=1 Tax=Polychytrium aggregatum TaxID=110093 RepID=UPI0022FE239E|nr:uncharacterized protein BJ171DRAFT_596795 [Polychytrium aggregatum]KAI9207217.1 hypothetical protein BJ171DRAFT_596795 [Polychytrium aggregatum]
MLNESCLGVRHVPALFVINVVEIACDLAMLPLITFGALFTTTFVVRSIQLLNKMSAEIVRRPLTSAISLRKLSISIEQKTVSARSVPISLAFIAFTIFAQCIVNSVYATNPTGTCGVLQEFPKVVPSIVVLCGFSFIAVPYLSYLLYKLDIEHPVRIELITNGVIYVVSMSMYLVWSIKLKYIEELHSFTSYFLANYWAVVIPSIQALQRIRLTNTQRKSSKLEFKFTLDCFNLAMSSKESLEKLEKLCTELFCGEIFYFLDYYKKLMKSVRTAYNESRSGFDVVRADGPGRSLISLASGSTAESSAANVTLGPEGQIGDFVPKKWILPKPLALQYIKVYKAYIRPGCSQELNIAHWNRETIKAIMSPFMDMDVEKLLTSDIAIPADCLDEIHQEIYLQMFNNIFPVFLDRKLYLNAEP